MTRQNCKLGHKGAAEIIENTHLFLRLYLVGRKENRNNRKENYFLLYCLISWKQKGKKRKEKRYYNLIVLNIILF